MLVLSAFGLAGTQHRVLTRGIDEALIQRADNLERDIVARNLRKPAAPGGR